MKHKKLATIEGAKELINDLQSSLTDIDTSIKSLNENIEKTENEIASLETSYALEDIEKTLPKRQLLAALKDQLEKAKAEKARIVEENHQIAYERALQILRNYSSEVHQAYKPEDELILKKIAEIKEIYNNLKKDQYEATDIVRSFRAELSPHLKPGVPGELDNVDFQLGISGRINIFDNAIDERKTGIKGLKPGY